MKLLLSFAAAFAFGVAVMCGMAVADWIIPDPPRAPLEVVHKTCSGTNCITENGGK